MAENKSNARIAFQGVPGAYSHLACTRVYPGMEVLPCQTFENMFAAVKNGKAKYAMTPIENSVAGRVADIHRLLPESGLYIVGEYFMRVNHHLLALPSATVKSIEVVRSHVHALSQCGKIIDNLRLKPVVHADTAGAAMELKRNGNKSEAVIASELAGKIYGLRSLRRNIEDSKYNTTRFVVMAREATKVKPSAVPLVTSFVFRVRNVPAALYKAMGGFATNGVNMTKLESYMVADSFNATQFYSDVDGHPNDPGLKLALEELAFFSHEIRILGTYEAHPFRYGKGADEPK
ncbi:MAG: prephenate dehydratase [Rhodospirillaceae bacterium]|nr:prephenate dehydratase [Rhodospirillaceae bacterium]|tara:strand:+ start:17214 stop:18086 length:873 start_codon:yes stop_codon:yes gene_type:complete